MRFLFGDSRPFQGGYHVLDALRHWVDAAVDLLLTARALEERQRTIEQSTEARLRELQALDDFFEGVRRKIHEEAERSGRSDVVAPHAHRLADEVAAAAHRARELSVQSFGDANGAVAAEIRGLTGALGARLGRYLRSAPLAMRGWELALAYPASEARGRLRIAFTEGLGAELALNLGSHPTWRRPLPLQELGAGLELEVGTRMTFFRGAPCPELVTLGEMYLTRFELAQDSMRLQLSSRPDPSTAELWLEVAGLTTTIRARIRREGGEPHESPASDHERLRHLHDALRRLARPLLRHQGTLQALHLDGDEHPIGGPAVRAVLARVSQRLAPLAMEVFEHSPNSQELSLKREHDDGRREELYLRLDELRQRVAALPAEELSLFASMPFLVESRPSALPRAVEPAAERARQPTTWAGVGSGAFAIDLRRSPRRGPSSPSPSA